MSFTESLLQEFFVRKCPNDFTIVYQEVYHKDRELSKLKTIVKPTNTIRIPTRRKQNRQEKRAEYVL